MGQTPSSRHKALFRTVYKDTSDFAAAFNAALLAAGIRTSFWVRPTPWRPHARVGRIVSYLVVDSGKTFAADPPAPDGSVRVYCRGQPSAVAQPPHKHAPHPPNEFYRLKVFIKGLPSFSVGKDGTGGKGVRGEGGGDPSGLTSSWMLEDVPTQWGEPFYETVCPLPMSEAQRAAVYAKVMNMYHFAKHLDEGLALRVAAHAALSDTFMQRIRNATDSLSAEDVERLKVQLQRNGFPSVVAYMDLYPGVLKDPAFRAHVVFPLLSFAESDLFDSTPMEVRIKDDWAKSLLTDYATHA